MPYSKISEAPANIRELDGVKLTLAQVNHIAEMADAIDPKKVKSPWAVAIANFKKEYVASGGKWVKRKKEKQAHPHGAHACVCPDCGAETEAEAGQKCNGLKCPECGARMRAQEIGERRGKELGEKGATDAEKKAQEARAKKHGIAVKDGGNVTKPGEWANVPDGQFLDPVNYRYPCPDAEQTRAAAGYWGKPKNQAQYSDKEKAVITKRLDGFRKKYKIGEFAEKALSGFKALPDGKWFGWWTTAYEDREQEIFATKAIEEFVDWVQEKGIKLPLWYWHSPVDLGQAEVVDIVGRIGIAAGTLNDWGLTFAKAFEEHPELGSHMSHKFLWLEKAKDDGVYQWFRTLELSVLPGAVAANLGTSFEGGMEMKEATKKALVELLGEEKTEEYLKAAENKDKELEAAGIAFKEVEKGQKDDEVPEEGETQTEEAPKEPLEVVMGDSVLDAIAERVVGKLNDSLQKLADVQAEQGKALDAHSELLKEIGKADEAKVKELLAGLPKATIHRASKEAPAEDTKDTPPAAEEQKSPAKMDMKESIEAIRKARAEG